MAVQGPRQRKHIPIRLREALVDQQYLCPCGTRIDASNVFDNNGVAICGACAIKNMNAP